MLARVTHTLFTGQREREREIKRVVIFIFKRRMMCAWHLLVI